MPFTDPRTKRTYKNFRDCVKKNQWAKNPEAFCSSIRRKVEAKEALKRGEEQTEKLKRK